MGTSTFLIEYTRLQKYIGDSSSGTAVYLKQHANDALLELCEAHDWPWLHYSGAVNMVAAYSTGTVTIVDSTTDYMTTTGTWSTAWSPVKVRTAGNHEYELTYNSGNSRWEMDRDLVEAESAVTYTLFKDTYTMPARLRSVFLAYPVTGGDDYPCQIVDEGHMRVLKSGAVLSRDPIEAICFGDMDATNLSVKLEVFPAPATANSVYVRGFRQVATLSSDADTYPFPASILPVYRHLALSNTYDWRARYDMAAAEREKYEAALSRAVNRADPSADAGRAVVLDKNWFGRNDSRPWRVNFGS